MTKKDCIKLASILNKFCVGGISDYCFSSYLFREIVKWLKEDSDKFDEEKFTEAVYGKKK